MYKNEKKALKNFLFIYITSTILLVSFILYIYYKNELKMLKESCNMELSNAAMHIKADIIDKYMKKLNFDPKKFKKNHIKYALADKNHKIIYSYLDKDVNIDFSKKMYGNKSFNYYIIELNEVNIPIKYIIVQTCDVIDKSISLKIFVSLVFVLAFIFIAFIGYCLSIILLKPVKQRVVNLDKFIKDSAHELNTPVSILTTSVSMLKKGKNPEKMMKYILSSSKQISQIYNDIQFSAFNEFDDKIEEEFNLDDLVTESIDYLSDIAITKNIKIVSSLEKSHIKMDKTKTQKLINNLILNAIKYSNKNSIIDVYIKNHILYVKDYGIGISKAEQKEIFKRYKRGNNNEGGFGIGLDIVKNICDEYKLTLSLNSKVNEGSNFNIDFSNIKCEN